MLHIKLDIPYKRKRIQRIKLTGCDEHHQSAADNCQLAKNELTKAETDKAITNAAKKFRVLCED